MSLIRRLFGAGGESRPSTVILYDSAQSNSPPPSDTEEPSEQRRRRGSRGGRGRGRSDSNASNNGNGNASGSGNGNRPAPSEPRGERRSDQQGRNTRWRRPALSSLDAPLPEDIAFRPAAEGGDASIVPARRRPVGPRTDRVLYAGIKQYVTREAEAEPLLPPLLAEVVVDVPADGDEEETQKRRRRGRRGGRRHRRDEDGAPVGAEADVEVHDSGDAQDVQEPEELHDEDETASDEIEERAVSAEQPERPRAERRRREPPAPAVEIDPASFPPAFRALGLSDQSLAAVAAFGFTTPSPIQEQTIPLLLGGRDVVGVAQTGTGKTLAFGLPMLECLDAGRRGVQGLVLVPTRELAQQVLEVLQQLGQPYGLEAVGLLGGRSLDRDFRALQQEPHVVVGTPGRVIDHLHRGTLSLSAVRYAVLDEADQMLDIGFLPDITRILTRTPRARQTALFSATMPHSILRLVRRYMENPETVTIAPEQTTVETVEQVYFEVAQRDKIRGLRELIERELRGRTLVFSRTRRGVDYLRDQLSDGGIRVGALHGDMDQRKRDQVVQQFRGGELDVLVATNVAARGLDIPEITHVLNYDVPQNPEEYVHRIGRTGRAGRAGKAITFVCERDVVEFDALLAAFGDRLRKEQLELYERSNPSRD